MNWDKTKEFIKRHEGLRLHAYKDQLGNLTIGYGHLCVKRPLQEITLQEAEQLLQYDMLDAWEILKHICPWAATFSENRQMALLDMAFQLGNKLGHFPKALLHLQREEFPEAAADFSNSLWAVQTPIRAEEDTNLIKEG